MKEIKKKSGGVGMIPTKTSKEIAIYLHDAIGFIPIMFPKQDQPKELEKLENETWVSVDAIRQKLQEFKVENEGTSETNASCCCHFESRVNYECPLKKMLLVGLEPEEAKK